jgi:hypothetical protein
LRNKRIYVDENILIFIEKTTINMSIQKTISKYFYLSYSSLE